jgi:myo-inositol-1(or 4)-monophosphatase
LQPEKDARGGFFAHIFHVILLAMTEILDFTANLAKEAGGILSDKYKQTGTRPEVKADLSVVTEVDLAVDRFIADAIQQRYPRDGIISEELRPVSPESKSAIWVVDPLDGTTNFALGLPFWGVSIARIKDGWPQAASLYFPTLNELYTAEVGLGAFYNQEPLKLLPPDDEIPAAFFSCCSRAHRDYWVEIPYKPRILGSAVYNFCALTRGVSILAFEAAPKIWDLAGGWLLVKEAGGIVESMDGPLPFPLQQGIDYRTIDYPTLAGASRKIIEMGRRKIRRRA